MAVFEPTGGLNGRAKTLAFLIGNVGYPIVVSAILLYFVLTMLPVAADIRNELKVGFAAINTQQVALIQQQEKSREAFFAMAQREEERDRELHPRK